jgi:hypothetical protein
MQALTAAPLCLLYVLVHIAALSNFCRGKPATSMSVVNKAVPGIVKLLRSTEEHEVTAQRTLTLSKNIFT